MFPLRVSLLLVLIAGIFLTNCAKKPEAIAPAYVSPMTYQNWTCSQLSDETQRLTAAYESVAAQQQSARTNDTIGVIFLGLPVASLSGSNVAPQVARIKGEQETIHKVASAKNCRHSARR